MWLYMHGKFPFLDNYAIHEAIAQVLFCWRAKIYWNAYNIHSIGCGNTMCDTNGVAAVVAPAVQDM